MNANMTLSEFKRRIEGVSVHPVEWDEQQPEPRKKLVFDNESDDDDDEEYHDYNECNQSGDCKNVEG